MWIKKLDIAGWRSFSPDRPTEFTDLRQVNVLIGPNNSGKSNLARFLTWLRDELVTSFFQAKGRPLWYAPFGRPVRLPQACSWRRGNDQIVANLGLELTAHDEDIWTKGDLLDDEDHLVNVRITVSRHSSTEGSLEIMPMLPDGSPFAEHDGNEWTHWTPTGGFRGSEDDEHSSAALEIVHILEDRQDKWVPRSPALHLGRYRRARPSTNERPRPPAEVLGRARA